MVPLRVARRRRRRRGRRIRVRSTWRRKAWPRPAPAAGALDQARARRRSSAGARPRRRGPCTPEVRLEGRERVVGDLRRARRSAPRGASTCRRSGSPTRPMSAISRSSRRSQRSSPGSPFWACLGAWWVDVVKCVLPRPPRPPRATIDLLPDRDEVGEQRAGLVVVDGRARAGPSRIRSSPALPWRRARVAAAAGRRPEVVLVAEVAERGLAGVDAEVDRAAAAAVAAVGAAARARGPPAGRSPRRRRRRRRGRRSSTRSRNIAAIVARDPAARPRRRATGRSGRGCVAA